MKAKRDGENASDVDCYGGEEVVVLVKAGASTAKGKDSASSHLTGRGGGQPSRLNHGGPCAVGLESTRFESSFAETTGNSWTGQMDHTGRSRGQITWSDLIGVST